MAFFDGDYFKGAFFKNEFFGAPFFQNTYFDDTTIAHGLTAITTTTETITITCNRTITGVFVAADFIVTIDGVASTVTDSTATGKDMVLTNGTMAAGEVIKVSYAGGNANNFGVIDNFDVTNEIVALATKPPRPRKKKAE